MQPGWPPPARQTRAAKKKEKRDGKAAKKKEQRHGRAAKKEKTRQTRAAEKKKKGWKSLKKENKVKHTRPELQKNEDKKAWKRWKRWKKGNKDKHPRAAEKYIYKQR